MSTSMNRFFSQLAVLTVGMVLATNATGVAVLVGHVAPVIDDAEPIVVSFDGVEVGTLIYREFAVFDVPVGAQEVVARRSSGALLAQRALSSFESSVQFELEAFDSESTLILGKVVTGDGQRSDMGFDWFVVPNPVLQPQNQINSAVATVHLAPFADINSSAVEIEFRLRCGSSQAGAGFRRFGRNTLGSGTLGSSGFGGSAGPRNCDAIFTPREPIVEFPTVSEEVQDGSTYLVLAIGDGVNQPTEGLWVEVSADAPVNPVVPVPPADLESQRFEEGFDGIWNDEDLINQGLLVREFSSGGSRGDGGYFVYLATFDEDQSPLWLYGFSDDRSAQTLSVDLFRFDGGAFAAPGVQPSTSQWGSATMALTECDALSVELVPVGGIAETLSLQRIARNVSARCRSSLDPELAGVQLYTCPLNPDGTVADFDPATCEPRPTGLAPRPNTENLATGPWLVTGGPSDLWQDVSLMQANKLVVAGQDRIVSSIHADSLCRLYLDPSKVGVVDVTGLSQGMLLRAGESYDVGVTLLAPPPSDLIEVVHCSPVVDIQLQGLGPIFQFNRRQILFVDGQ